jgi:sortase B
MPIVQITSSDAPVAIGSMLEPELPSSEASLSQSDVSLSVSARTSVFSEVSVKQLDDDYGIIPQYLEAAEKNIDVTGWIHIPDSGISYPVMMGSYDEPDFYLSHDITRKKTSVGSIYLAAFARGNFDGFVLVSGHAMKNGSMFGQLLKYKKQNWASSHQTIYVYDGERIMAYQVFACVLVNASHETLTVDFATQRERLVYLSEIADRSVIEAAPISDPMNVLVLNTCSYEANNYRCLVFASRLRRDS